MMMMMCVFTSYLIVRIRDTLYDGIKIDEGTSAVKNGSHTASAAFVTTVLVVGCLVSNQRLEIT